MAEFVNTLDIMADEDVLDLFIKRHNTEYKDEHIRNIGAKAFANCTELARVELPNVLTLGAYAFQFCSSLTYLTLDSVTTIGTYCFNNCLALSELILPNITAIPANAFGDCIALKKVDIASQKVTSITTNSFINAALEHLIIRRQDVVCRLASTAAFSGTPIANGTGYIYVPADLLESYRTADRWSTFAAQIVAIEDHPDICDYV